MVHRGRFLFGRQFEEIAFCTEDAFITPQRKGKKNSDTYAEGSSREDDIGTEDGSGRARFQLRGPVRKRAVSIRRTG